MQLKLFLLFGFTAAGTMIGFFLFKRGKEKEEYFVGLKDMATCLICDIKFSRNNIQTLVENFETKSELLKRHKKQFDIGLNEGNFQLEKAWLKDSHYAAVNNFFGNLGRFDGETQIYQLENQRDKLSAIADEFGGYNKKYGKMKIKLGFLFGLAAGILLL